MSEENTEQLEPSQEEKGKYDFLKPYQFKKGQSGNPSGRAKYDREVKVFLCKHSMEAAIKIVELLRSKSDKIAFAAAQEILNRTEGKPLQTQQIEVGGNLDVRSQVRAILLERENERLKGLRGQTPLNPYEVTCNN